MSIKPVILFSLYTSLMSPPLPAEVVLDGTLGIKGDLPGPDYQISADLGQQHGGNLFHSFRDFNLQSHESATFSGPDTVKNVISRVTGGNPSTIDGTLRSTIPEANLYFLNPAGIMFGEHAWLDVQGSFHASTADVLRLGNEGSFSARQPENSILSVAPPSAFGFLTNSPAPLTTQESFLSVPPGKSLSLIGGDIHLQGNSPHFKFSFKPYEARPEPEKGSVVASKVPQVSSLTSESGRVNLASVASPGEVIPTESGLQVGANTQGGHILVNNTLIETSGPQGGSIVIQGGHLELINSGIISKTHEFGKGEQINIHADNLTLLQGAVIATGTISQGQGGDISLKVTDALTISGISDGSEGDNPHSSGIYSSTQGTELQAGKAGKIDIEARRLTLTEGSQIGSGTFGAGDGSAISIRVTDTLTIAGKHIQDGKEYRSGIYASSEGEMIESSGSHGESSLPLDLPTPEVLPENSAPSETTSSPSKSPPAMPSAEIPSEIPAGSEAMLPSSDSPPPLDTGEEQIHPPVSEEPVVKTFPNTGNAGSIYIESGQIVLKNGAISTDTAGSGKGGNVTIGRAQQVTLTEGAYITSGTRGTGSGGTLNLSVAGTLTLSDSRIYGDSLSLEANAGDAGEIKIQANQMQLTQRGKINTSSQNAAGGNVTLTVPHLLYLQNGDITTSVKGGEGRGGNLTIQSPTFVILDQGVLKAQADAGRGGDIQIRSQQFLHTPHSVVSASSKLGIDGKIVISAPAEQVSKSLLVVSIPLKDLSHLLKPLCSVNLEEETRSSFLVFRLAGSSPWPDDLQPSHPVTTPVGKPAKLNVQRTKTSLSSASAVIGCSGAGN